MDAKLIELEKALRQNRSKFLLLAVVAIGLVVVLTRGEANKVQPKSTAQTQSVSDANSGPTPTPKPTIPDNNELQQTIQFKLPEGWEKEISPHSHTNWLWLDDSNYQYGPSIHLAKNYLDENASTKTPVKDFIEGRISSYADVKPLEIAGYEAVAYTYNDYNWGHTQVFLIQLPDSFWTIEFIHIVPKNSDYNAHSLVTNFLNSLAFGYRKQVQDLKTAWETGAALYKHSSMPLTFRYPSFLIVNEVDTKSENANWRSKYPERNEDIYGAAILTRFSTPDVLAEERSKPGFDILFYRKNTMVFNIEMFDNPENLPLDDFLRKYYKNPGIDGKTSVYDSMKADLVSSNTPIADSYIMKGVGGGEHPKKTYFFTYKGKVYQMTMYGGIDTGEQYSEEAEKVFDEVVKSIQFDQ